MKSELSEIHELTKGIAKMVAEEYSAQQKPTLRDMFAIAALPTAWSAYDKGYWTCEAEDINRTITEAAYQMADAMLKTRDRLAE